VWWFGQRKIRLSGLAQPILVREQLPIIEEYLPIRFRQLQQPCLVLLGAFLREVIQQLDAQAELHRSFDFRQQHESPHPPGRSFRLKYVG